MDDPKPRNPKILLWWFLGNGLALAVYLSVLHHFSRKYSDAAHTRVFYVSLTLTGIYLLPMLGYCSMPGGQSRKFDRLFIVWGCVTTFFVSLVCVAASRR